MKEFQLILNQLRSELSGIKNSGKAAAPKLGVPFPNYKISTAVAHKIDQLISVVEKDINRYAPRAKDEAHLEEAIHQDQQEKIKAKLEAEASHKDGGEHTVDAESGEPASDSTKSPSTEVESYIRSIQIYPEIKTRNNPHVDSVKLSRMSPHIAELYVVIDDELRYLKDNMSIMSNASSIVQKLDKALAFVGANRLGDAINILHRLKKDAPNNRIVSFIVSQMAFFMARSGMTQHLSEAREEGKKSCLLGDGVNEDRLHKYRYNYIVSEAHYGVDKIVPKMREFYMLNPESLTGRDGYNVHNSYHFKTLLFLSKIPAKLWGAYERQTVIDVAYHNISGALFYITLFRPLLLDAIVEGKKDYEVFAHLEEDLQFSFIQYSNCVQALQENFTLEGKMIGAGKYFWTTHARYLHAFLNAGALPTFDSILANISLNARRTHQEGQLVRHLKENGLAEENYWHIWARKITPIGDLHREDAIPDAQVIKTAALSAKYEEALHALQQLENNITQTPKWEPAQPFMIKFDYSKLIEQSTGKPSTLNSRSPISPIFKDYYQLWNHLTEPEILPSDLVLKTARNGGFDNLDEAQDLFDGIEQVITDELQGLKARIDTAYQRYLKHKAEEEGDVGFEFLGVQDHFQNYWWLYLIVAPVAFIIFSIVVFSKDYITATKSIAILAGLGLFLGLFFSKKK